MKQSHVIEIDGVFVGAAAFYGDSYRFVGVHSRLKELDGHRFADLSQVREAASRVYRLAAMVAHPSVKIQPARAAA